MKENKIRVKLYKRDGQVVLIGHEKEIVIIPVTEIEEDELTELDGTILVSRKTINAGVAYGVYWSDVLGNSDVAIKVAQELYNVGIFNEEDVLKRVPAVQGALRKALGIDKILSSILDYSRDEKRKNKKV